MQQLTNNVQKYSRLLHNMYHNTYAHIITTIKHMLTSWGCIYQTIGVTMDTMANGSISKSLFVRMAKITF